MDKWHKKQTEALSKIINPKWRYADVGAALGEMNDFLMPLMDKGHLFEASPKNFKYLEPPHENEYIRVKQTGHLYAGWDGAHRISCEKKRGKKTIKVELMSGDFKHKGYSNIIDVPKIFDNIDYDDYIIIKDDDMFPNYTDRDDLDIICKDRKVLCEYILKELEVYKEYGYEIVVKEKGVRHHIDLIPPGFVDMNYRIDLLDEFPYLQQFHHHTNKIEVKDEFYDFLLERKIKKEFEYLIMY